MSDHSHTHPAQTGNPYEAWWAATPDAEQQFDEWYDAVRAFESHRVAEQIFNDLADLEGNKMSGCVVDEAKLRYLSHVHDVCQESGARWPKAPWLS
ncbi:MAG: hypothetical protein ABWZ99_18390 [Ilumatobacteraceae bacterium]